MTSALKGAAKAAADREKAITKTIARMGGVIEAGRASSQPADVASANRCRAMIGRSVNAEWKIVGTDGHIALLHAADGDGTTVPLLDHAVAGPSIALPAAFLPTLKRVRTCADLTSKASPIAGGVRIMIGAERMTLATRSEGCSANEWLPGDGAALAGRNVALSVRYLLEAVAIVGADGHFALCAPRHVVRDTRTIDDDVTFEAGPVALISDDRLWAVVVMGLAFPKRAGAK